MQTVLVGLDVPTAAAEPLRWAADYASVIGAELIGVVGYQSSQAESPPDRYEAQIRDARNQAEKAMDAGAATVPHRVDLRYGGRDRQ